MHFVFWCGSVVMQKVYLEQKEGRVLKLDRLVLYLNQCESSTAFFVLSVFQWHFLM